MQEEYNKTQLSPDKEFERHIFHRDQFAHYLRWTHVLKISKLGNNILDLGCGTGNLLEVLYRNKHKCSLYYGIDIRKQTIEHNKERFKDIIWGQFRCADLIKGDLNDVPIIKWDIITCFEVFEHVNKKNCIELINKIKKFANKDTIILISTPCYDESVGAANNHILNGMVQEYTYNEFKDLMETHFNIIENFGTFASQKDYKNSDHFNTLYKAFYDDASKYFDSNILSNLMASVLPEFSRNVLWKVKLK